MGEFIILHHKSKESCILHNWVTSLEHESRVKRPSIGLKPLRHPNKHADVKEATKSMRLRGTLHGTGTWVWCLFHDVLCGIWRSRPSNTPIVTTPIVTPEIGRPSTEATVG